MSTPTVPEQIAAESGLPIVMDLPEDFNPETQKFFEVMDRRAGDYKIIWDRTKTDETEMARDTFNKLKKKGYMAYSVGGDGEKDKKIDEFDPQAERIIMVPPVQGG